MSHLKSIYLYIRYERAIIFWLLQLTAIVIVGIFCAWLFLQSALAEALGFSRIQERGAALQSALFWQYRTWKNSDLPPQSYTRHYGFINSATNKGNLIITIADDAEFKLREVALANLMNIKVDGLAAAAATRKRESVVFDIYSNNHAVVWINKYPWNVALITNGLAEPSKNPQTNVVDRAFAEYFWAKFKGVQK